MDSENPALEQAIEIIRQYPKRYVFKQQAGEITAGNGWAQRLERLVLLGCGRPLDPGTLSALFEKADTRQAGLAYVRMDDEIVRQHTIFAQDKYCPAVGF
jgi:hypothetical protein